MKNISPLNDVQRSLVEENLFVVKLAIRSAVVVNETIYGFEYDDLFQEGCIWLCKAAVNYRPESGIQFSTFACTVVANGLRTYCRLMCNKQKRFVTIPNYSEPDKKMLSFEEFPAIDEVEYMISEYDTICLLNTLKQQYSGTVLRGIEALEWKVKGYSGTQIAEMYGVKPNLVGAWISRAVRKLEQNSMFILWRDNLLVEKTAS